MQYVHPFTGALYENAEGSNVRVQLEDKSGVLTWDGRWISGALRQADPNLCIYVAGGYGGGSSPELLKSRGAAIPREKSP